MPFSLSPFAFTTRLAQLSLPRRCAPLLRSVAAVLRLAALALPLHHKAFRISRITALHFAARRRKLFAKIKLNFLYTQAFEVSVRAVVILGLSRAVLPISVGIFVFVSAGNAYNHAYPRTRQ